MNKDMVIWISLGLLVVLTTSVFVYGIFFNQEANSIHWTQSQNPLDISNMLKEQKEELESEIDMASFKLSSKLIPLCQTAIERNIETRGQLSDKIIDMMTEIESLKVEIEKLKNRSRK